MDNNAAETEMNLKVQNALKRLREVVFKEL